MKNSHIRKIDLLGKRFNHWVVIGESKIVKKQNRQSRTHWLCMCDCGTIKYVYANSLTFNKSLSCGCIARKKQPGETAKHEIFLNYKCKCVRKNLEFKLSKDEFNVLIDQNCYYCGASPSNKSGNEKYGYYIYNGIDRIDNNRGYELTNVVSCCKNCNLAKRKLTQEQFFELIKCIYERHLK